MKVKYLIEKLKECDMDAEVVHLWDGETRTAIEHVYMGKTGDCITADYGMVAYSNNARPLAAPDSKDDRYWKTPENPNADYDA